MQSTGDSVCGLICDTARDDVRWIGGEGKVIWEQLPHLQALKVSKLKLFHSEMEVIFLAHYAIKLWIGVKCHNLFFCLSIPTSRDFENHILDQLYYKIIFII